MFITFFCYASAALIGANSLLTQLGIIRELSLFISGNEIFIGLSLAIWVAGTGLGSDWLPHKLLPKTFRITPTFYFVLSIICVALFPLIIFIARAYHRWFNSSGMELGFGSMLLLCTFLILPFALLHGFWYSSLLYLIDDLRPKLKSPVAFPAGTLFAFEAFGAGCIGIVYTLVLAFHWQPFEIAAIWLPICFTFSTLSAFIFSPPSYAFPKKAFLLSLTIFSLLIVLFKWFGFWQFIETATLRALPFPGTQIINQFTPLGHLTLTQQKNAYTYFYSGKPVYSFPDPQSNEPQAFLPFLLFPNASHVLVVGFNPDVIVCLTSISRLHTLDLYIEDPIAFQTFLQKLPFPWQKAFQDPRVHYFYGDPRQLLTHSQRTYDLILFPSIPPATLSSNRFYTSDFLQVLNFHLSNQGILLYSFAFSENRSKHSEYLVVSTLAATMKQAFLHFRFLATDRLYLCASPENPIESLTLAEFETRFQKVRSPLWTYRSEQIPFLLDVKRAEEIQKRFNPGRLQQINSDQRPVMSGLHSLFWLSQHHGFSTLLTLFLILSGFVFWLRSFWKGSDIVRIIQMFMSGAALMTLQLIVISTQQIRHGNIWIEIGLLFSSVMLGLALGGIAGNYPFKNTNRTIRVLAAVLLAVLCTAGALVVGTTNSLLTGVIILIMGGLCAGWIYSDTTRNSEAKLAAIVWSADLAGSSLGALFTGTVLLPVLGPWAGLIVASLLLFSFIPLEIFQRFIFKR